MANNSDSRRFSSIRPVLPYLVAAALGVLTLVGWLFFFVANDEYTWWRTGVVVREASLLSPDRLRLGVNSCNRNPEVTLLRETNVDVQVKVVTPPIFISLGSAECGDSVNVQLQEPLRDRDVVDKHTGKVVRDASRYVEVSVAGTSLTDPDRVMFHISSCNIDPDRNPEVSHLMETDSDIQVRVVAKPHPSLPDGADCRDRSVAIRLQEALGDRAIVDMRTRKVMRLQSR